MRTSPQGCKRRPRTAAIPRAPWREAKASVGPPGSRGWGRPFLWRWLPPGREACFSFTGQKAASFLDLLLRHHPCPASACQVPPATTPRVYTHLFASPPSASGSPHVNSVLPKCYYHLIIVILYPSCTNFWACCHVSRIISSG